MGRMSMLARIRYFLLANPTISGGILLSYVVQQFHRLISVQPHFFKLANEIQAVRVLKVI